MNRKEVEEFLNSREDYGEILNPKIDFLVAAVVPDCNEFMRYEIVGFAEDGENWSIKYGETQARIPEENVWKELDENIHKRFVNEAGEIFRPEVVCIDSAGIFTDEIYRECTHRREFEVCKFYTRYKNFFVTDKTTNYGWNELALHIINTISGEKIMSCMLKKRENCILSHFPKDPQQGYGGDYYSSLAYGTENYYLRMLIIAGAYMQATKAPKEDMRGLW